MSEIAPSPRPTTLPSLAATEQRGHPRTALFLDALLSGGLLDARACKIRDCCPDGLFLTLDPADGELTYTSERRIARGDEVEVQFFAPLDGQGRSFTLWATVVRVLGHGIGVALRQPDRDAQRALAELAERGPANPPAPRLRAGEAAVLEQLGARLGSLLAEGFGGVALQAEGMLMEAIREAGSDAAQRRLFDVLTRFNAGAARLRGAVVAAGAQAVERLGRGSPQPRIRRPAAEAEQGTRLSLVDKRDFEEFLVLAELVDRVEPEFNTELLELEDRLSALCGRRVDRADNPFSAGAICASFSEALRGFTEDLDALRVLHRTVERALHPLLGPFYAELRGSLEAAGVQPMRRPAAPAARVTPGAGPQPVQKPAPVESEPPPGAVASGGWSAQGTMVAGPVPAHGAARRLFALRRALGQGGHGQSGAASPALEAELLGALAHWRAAGAPGRSPAAALEPLSEAPLPEATRPEVQESLEFVGEVLDAVLRDPRVVDAVKPLLARLHLPLQQAVLRDAGVLDRAEQPARRLVEALGALRSLNAADPDGSLAPRLQALVERVGAEAASHPDVFAEAALEVERLVAEQQQVYVANLARLVAEAEEQQRVLKARRRPEDAARDPLARLPEAMQPYVARARSVRVGDEVTLTRGREQRRARVGWVAEGQQSFLLTDTLGRRLTNVGLQEFAMQLRRGSATLVERRTTPVVESALLESVERLHRRVERDAGQAPADDAADHPSVSGGAVQAASGDATHGLDAVAAALARALDEGRLGLVLAPLRGPDDEAPEHLCLEPRLPDAQGQVVPADALWQAAEALGRAAELDRWLLRRGLAEAAAVTAARSGGWLLLRLSAASLAEPGLPEFLTELLMTTPVAPGRLCFEFADTRSLDDAEGPGALVRQLKDFGCRVAVGDFGAPHTSLTALRELSPALGRIHGLRERDILGQHRDAVVLESVVAMARFLGLPLIAHPVDDPALHRRLRELGVDYVQGAVAGPERPLAG